MKTGQRVYAGERPGHFVGYWRTPTPDRRKRQTWILVEFAPGERRYFAPEDVVVVEAETKGDEHADL